MESTSIDIVSAADIILLLFALLDVVVFGALFVWTSQGIPKIIQWGRRSWAKRSFQNPWTKK